MNDRRVELIFSPCCKLVQEVTRKPVLSCIDRLAIFCAGLVNRIKDCRLSGCYGRISKHRFELKMHAVVERLSQRRGAVCVEGNRHSHMRSRFNTEAGSSHQSVNHRS